MFSRSQKYIVVFCVQVERCLDIWEHSYHSFMLKEYQKRPASIVSTWVPIVSYSALQCRAHSVQVACFFSEEFITAHNCCCSISPARLLHRALQPDYLLINIKIKEENSKCFFSQSGLEDDAKDTKFFLHSLRQKAGRSVEPGLGCEGVGSFYNISFWYDINWCQCWSDIGVILSPISALVLFSYKQDPSK